MTLPAGILRITAGSSVHRTEKSRRLSEQSRSTFPELTSLRMRPRAQRCPSRFRMSRDSRPGDAVLLLQHGSFRPHRDLCLVPLKEELLIATRLKQNE